MGLRHRGNAGCRRPSPTPRRPARRMRPSIAHSWERPGVPRQPRPQAAAWRRAAPRSGRPASSRPMTSVPHCSVGAWASASAAQPKTTSSGSANAGRPGGRVQPRPQALVKQRQGQAGHARTERSLGDHGPACPGRFEIQPRAQREEHKTGRRCQRSEGAKPGRAIEPAGIDGACTLAHQGYQVVGLHACLR